MVSQQVDYLIIILGEVYILFGNSLGLNVGDEITYSLNIESKGYKSNLTFYAMIFDSSGTRLQGNYLGIIYNNTTWWTGDSRGMTSVASGDKRREKITIKWLQAIQDVIDDGGYVAMSIQTNNITLDDENSYLDMYAPKVEIGNKATDWSPAPEDTDQDINDRVTAVSNQITKDKGELEEKIGKAKGIAESKLDADQVAEAISTAITANNAELKIDSLRGAIQALTTQTDGKYQILEQDGEGWSFSFGSLIEDVVKTMGDANEALEKLDGTKDSNLKTRLSSWEEANSYIRIERRNNAPVIVLATNQDNFRVEISNSSIDFYEGNNRIAYVSNQAFYNTTGIVREEIRIMSDESGGFAWKTRQNGNLGLTWLAQISG